MSLDHSIQWRNFHSDITSAIKILRDDEDFVDVTLACEGNQVKAHKMVLSACSPYFKSLLKTNPCQHPIVFLKDVKLANLISILNFMYHGEVDILQNEVATFLETAKALEVRGLSEYGTRKESSKHLEDHSSGPTIIDHTPPKRQGLEPSTPANDGSVHLTKSPIPHKKRRLSITTLSEGDKEASQFATREEESAVVKDETLDIDMEDYQSLLTDCINSVHVQTGILIKEDVGRKNSNQLSCSDIASTPFAHSSPQDYFHQILNRLSHIDENIVEVKEAMKAVLQNNDTKDTKTPALINPSDLPKLPANNQEEWNAFLDWIRMPNVENRRSLVTYLSTFGGVRLPDVIRRMILKLVTATFATQINFTGTVKNIDHSKISFKNSEVWMIIIESVRRLPEYALVTERSIEEATMNFFRHAKKLKK